MIDDTASQTVTLLVRAPRGTVNIFQFLKNAVEQMRLRGSSEISMAELKKLTRGDINEFTYSKRSEDDFNILKSCLKEFGVKYNLKKSRVKEPDGLTDYFFYFDARDKTIVKRCLSEFQRRMDERESVSFEGLVNSAERELGGQDIDRSMSKDRQKQRSKNRDINMHI